MAADKPVKVLKDGTVLRALEGRTIRGAVLGALNEFGPKAYMRHLMVSHPAVFTKVMLAVASGLDEREAPKRPLRVEMVMEDGDKVVDITPVKGGGK